MIEGIDLIITLTYFLDQGTKTKSKQDKGYRKEQANEVEQQKKEKTFNCKMESKALTTKILGLASNPQLEQKAQRWKADTNPT